MASLFAKKPFAAAFLAAVTFAVYANTLLNGFVYDDNDLILRNPWITDFSHIKEIFTSTTGSFVPGIHSGTYRPLIHVLYAAQYALFGLEPWGYHLVNVILQAIAVMLVYLLSIRLLGDDGKGCLYALAGAFYFAIHPVHTEVVAWVSTLAELCLSILFLSAILLHIRGSFLCASLSWICFFAALLFKETALMLPAVLFAYDVTIGRDKGWKVNIARYVPFVIATIFYFMLKTYAVKEVLPGRNWFDLTYFQYFLSVFPVIMIYFQKLIIPTGLHAYYHIEPVRSIAEPRAFVSVVLTLAYCALLYFACRKNKTAAFLLAWIPLTFLPPLYLPGLGRSFFADRYVYLPSVGFSILAAYVAMKAFSRRPIHKGQRAILASVFIAIAVLFIGHAVQRNAVWKNEFTLWSDAVEKSPEAAIPHYNLGHYYAEAGQTGKAIEEFAKTIEKDGSFEAAHYNLGVLYEKSGDLDRAIAHFERSSKLSPGQAQTHMNIGKAYYKKEAYEKAAMEFIKALSLDPGLEEARSYIRLIEGRDANG